MAWVMGLKHQDIYEREMNSMAKGITTFLLSLKTTIKNMTDIGKASSWSGGRNTAETIIRQYVLWNKKDRRLAKDLIGSKAVFTQSLERAGLGGRFAQEYSRRMIGFTASESGVRKIMGHSAIISAQHLLKNYIPGKDSIRQRHIKRQWDRLTDGLDFDKAKKRGHLTRSEMLRIGNNAIGVSQPASNLDKPYNWISKGLWTRKSIFQSFSHKGIRFVKDFVLKETAKGNMMPFVNLILWRLALGYGYQEVVRWLFPKDEKEEKDAFKKAWDIFTDTGELGIIGDLIFAVQHAGWVSPFISLMFGPGYALAFESLWNVGIATNKTIQGKENPGKSLKRQLSRYTTKRLPLVGEELYRENYGRKKKKKSKKKPAYSEIITRRETPGRRYTQ